MATSVLVTKLFVPSTRAKLVHRTSLIERMNDGLDRKLTLLSAPAGFGKTTLVSHWVENLRDNNEIESHPIKVAWLSLEKTDNDLARFLSYFITALQMIDNDIGQKAQAVFQSQQRLLLEPIILSLINDIFQYSRHTGQDSLGEIVFVLDDYHVIDEPEIHQAIKYFIEHQPPQFHLVILTRVDPPLQLSRLRARNQMVEIRGANLHFTEEEVDVFLNKIMKLDLAPDEIALLVTTRRDCFTGNQNRGLGCRTTISSNFHAGTGESW